MFTLVYEEGRLTSCLPVYPHDGAATPRRTLFPPFYGCSLVLFTNRVVDVLQCGFKETIKMLSLVWTPDIS